jgi:site-specific DNA recombinase
VRFQVGQSRRLYENFENATLGHALEALHTQICFELHEAALSPRGKLVARLQLPFGGHVPVGMRWSCEKPACRYPCIQVLLYSAHQLCTNAFSVRRAATAQMRLRKNVVLPENRRTIGYVRVSTEEQAKEGVSLSAQEARIAAYCAAMGFDVPEVVRDAGDSAKNLQRPGMAKVVAGVRAGTVERIVVLKLDRLTRSMRDLTNLLDLFAKKRVALVSVGESLDTSSASGRLVVNMFGIVAQWERETIAERTATALAHKRHQGQVYGAIPFGYTRVGDALIPEPREQAALAKAIKLDRAGASFREIAAHLSALGVMPHRARAWHASSVRAVLRSRLVQEGRR